MNSRFVLELLLTTVLALAVSCTGATPTAVPEATPVATRQSACQSAAPTPGVAFERGTQSFPGRNTFQVALGDLDGDGDLDILVAYFGDGSSEVWFNKHLSPNPSPGAE